VTLTHDVFRAVSDPTRRGIIDALAAGERTVSELCALFDVTQSAVSQHLRVLRETGLVVVRVQGRHRHYRLQAGPLQAVHDWTASYRHFWSDRLDAIGAALDREAARLRRKGRRS
jgi:DNA-binding transcriptional ArsR family regulator